MSTIDEVLSLMESTRVWFFSDLNDIAFRIEKTLNIDGVTGVVIFGSPTQIILYYSDDRVLEPRYRMGLVPLISHELAHLIDPVDPERVVAERLPKAMIQLWAKLREAGLARCSMDA